MDGESSKIRGKKQKTKRQDGFGVKNHTSQLVGGDPNNLLSMWPYFVHLIKIW